MAASTAGRKRVRFQLQADSGKSVYIAGSFNDWKANQKKMTEKDGKYEANLMLPKGRFEYKFVVDGTWCVDPECSEWTQNELGSLNSVVTVG